jgi:cation diffusion facilitator family transporter
MIEKTQSPSLHKNLNIKVAARAKSIGAAVSVGVGVLVLAIKFFAYFVTHSQAVYSDAVESIVNVLAAVLSFGVIYYANKPADEDHPYGHGKMENFSVAFEGGLVTIAAVFVAIEAIGGFSKQTPLQKLDLGLVLIVVAGLMNLGLGIYLKKLGTKYNSDALVASGTHVMTDFQTTAATLLALGLVHLTGVQWIDPLIAMLFAIHLGFAGSRLVKKAIGELMDAEDLTTLEALAQLFTKHIGDGIIQVHHTKVIRSGGFHHIDAHLVVPEFWSIEEAHHKLDLFENKVLRDYRFDGEANFHLDPCRKNYCRVCDLPDCKIRQAKFEEKMPVALEHLRSRVEPKEFRN